MNHAKSNGHDPADTATDDEMASYMKLLDQSINILLGAYHDLFRNPEFRDFSGDDLTVALVGPIAELEKQHPGLMPLLAARMVHQLAHGGAS